MNETEDEGPCTLYVRHLPAQLPLAEREDLLRFFGARSVRCMSDSGNMKYSAFAVFPSPDLAAHALQELHQLNVLGSTLCVQFSGKQFLHPAPVKVTKQKKDKPVSQPEQPLEPVVPDDIDHLASFHKLDYPLNPKLMYSYPSPTVEIITNIANTLASVPKFYVQVLHLMNKMNLPAPFGPVTQAPPIPSGFQEPIQELDMNISSSEESELESETEAEKPVLGVPRKRPASDKKPLLKRIKLQRIISAPKSGKTLKREEVFEKPSIEKPKIKVQKSTNKNVSDIFTEEKDVKKFITLKELEKNRLSSRRFRRTPLFKNYKPGDRNSILMVENLHKDVPEAMITYVFGRYINWESEIESGAYTVNLDRETRSCTVTFPSDDIAELALQETNGFMLMGEYMVVRFAPKAPEPVLETPEISSKIGDKSENLDVVTENLTVIEAAFAVSEDSAVDAFNVGETTPPCVTIKVTSEATPPRVTGEATPPRVAREATPPRVTREATSPRVTGEATPPRVTKEATPPRVTREATPPCVVREVTPPHVIREATPEPMETDTGEQIKTDSSGVKLSEEKEAETEKVETTDELEEIAAEIDQTEAKEAEEEIRKEEMELEEYEDPRYISPSELKKSRITEDKMVNFKVFNNYQPGEPSNRLYIKNLNPKEIKEFELIWLFGRFLKDRSKDASDVLVVKIMKEGRMKGQAFVTFPSAKEAQFALKMVNGFVLHGKPMVVQFGKQA